MLVQTKAEKMEEIKFQEKMLNNLRLWMRILIMLSSLLMIVSYWALKLKDGLCYNIVGGVSIFFMVVAVIACATVGLAYKNGKANVAKITSAL